MTLSSGNIFRALAGATGGVVLAGWLLPVCEYWVCPGIRHISFFDLNAEINLPTWWSTALLLICAALTALMAALKRNDRFWWGWFFLALGFLFMSLDEVAQLHEKLSGPVREALHLSGFLYYGWVVPAAALLVVVGLSYIRFFLALPKGIRGGFLLGWAVYLAGVLGMESWGASASFRWGEENFFFALLAALEETLEMAGLLILIRVFLSHIVLELQNRSLTLAR